MKCSGLGTDCRDSICSRQKTATSPAKKTVTSPARSFSALSQKTTLNRAMQASSSSNSSSSSGSEPSAHIEILEMNRLTCGALRNRVRLDERQSSIIANSLRMEIYPLESLDTILPSRTEEQPMDGRETKLKRAAFVKAKETLSAHRSRRDDHLKGDGSDVPLRAKLVYQYLEKGIEGGKFSPVPDDHSLKDCGGTYDTDMNEVYTAARILSGRYSVPGGAGEAIFDNIMDTLFQGKKFPHLGATDPEPEQKRSGDRTGVADSSPGRRMSERSGDMETEEWQAPTMVTPKKGHVPAMVTPEKRQQYVPLIDWRKHRQDALSTLYDHLSGRDGHTVINDVIQYCSSFPDKQNMNEATLQRQTIDKLILLIAQGGDQYDTLLYVAHPGGLLLVFVCVHKRY